MKNRLSYILVMMCLLLSILSLCIGCGKKDINTTTAFSITVAQSNSGQLVSAVDEASGEEEHQQAFKEIASTGFSLGLLDLEGNQLNPNVPDDAINLSPVSITMYAQMDAGNYRTIGYVVDFLADAGVRLTSTATTIDVNNFLPDLQDYINWSYVNPNDPASVLGILIASGNEMKIPDSPPTLNANTKISPFASLLLMSDVLVGVDTSAESPLNIKSGRLLAKSAANTTTGNTTTGTQVLDKVRGLITTVMAFPVLPSLLPEKAKNILSAFETCDRLSVRMWQAPDTINKEKNWINNITANLSLAKTFKLEKGKTESVTIIGGVGMMAGISGSPLQTVEGVEITYRFQLLSDDEQGTGVPLYDDADAVLNGLTNAEVDNYTFSADLNGHRFLAGSKGNVPFMLNAKTMNNPEIRRTLLHASAEINAPDIDSLYQQAEQKIKEKLIDSEWGQLIAMNALETLPWDKVKETMILLERDFQPTPWMCTVEFSPVKNATVTTTGPKPAPPTVNIDSPTSGTIFTEGEDIILSVSAIDYLGKPIPDIIIDTNTVWEYDYGMPLYCNSLSDGYFKVLQDLPPGTYIITANLIIEGFNGSDYIEITIVEKEKTPLELLLSKSWIINMEPGLIWYVAPGPLTKWGEVRFYENGSADFYSEDWESVWVINGNSFEMTCIYDYKTPSQPDWVINVLFIGTIEETSGSIVLKGEYKQWMNYNPEDTLRLGTWTT